jgi:hypothetical protein
MRTGSPGEDLSEFEAEVEDGAPPAVETLTIPVLARRRLLRHGLHLGVVLRTLESMSPVQASRRLPHCGLLLRVFVRTSKLRLESGTELLWLRGRSSSLCWPTCTSCAATCFSRAVRTSSSSCASLGTSRRSPCDSERSPCVSEWDVSASHSLCCTARRIPSCRIPPACFSGGGACALCWLPHRYATCASGSTSWAYSASSYLASSITSSSSWVR